MKRFTILGLLSTVCASLSALSVLTTPAYATATFTTDKSNVEVGEEFTISLTISDVAAWNVHIEASGAVENCALHAADVTDDARNTTKEFTKTCQAKEAGEILISLRGDYTNETNVTETLASSLKVTVKEQQGGDDSGGSESGGESGGGSSQGGESGGESGGSQGGDSGGSEGGGESGGESGGSQDGKDDGKDDEGDDGGKDDEGGDDGKDGDGDGKDGKDDGKDGKDGEEDGEDTEEDSGKESGQGKSSKGAGDGSTSQASGGSTPGTGFFTREDDFLRISNLTYFTAAAIALVAGIFVVARARAKSKKD